MLFRFSLFALALATLTYSASSAYGQDTADYRPVSVATLTHMTVNLKAVDLQDATAFEEYLKIMDCDRYTKIKNSQFKLQELQHATLRYLDQTRTEEKEGDLYISIPTTFITMGYNFDTQSLDIIPDNQLRRVNILFLTGPRDIVCGTAGNDFNKLPTFYRTQLNAPVSLYRIPMQKNLAETVMTRLDISRGRETHRIIYGNVLVRIENVQPEIINSGAYNQAIGTVRGQVAAIDLHMDYDRKIRFKRLSYIDGF